MAVLGTKSARGSLDEGQRPFTAGDSTRRATHILSHFVISLMCEIFIDLRPSEVFSCFSGFLDPFPPNLFKT